MIRLGLSIFNDYNYDIVELNASEQRSKKMIHEKVSVIGKYSVNAIQNIEERKKVGLIMDEIDGIVGGDRGGVQELVDMIETQRAYEVILKTKKSLFDWTMNTKSDFINYEIYEKTLICA